MPTGQVSSRPYIMHEAINSICILNKQLVRLVISGLHSSIQTKDPYIQSIQGESEDVQFLETMNIVGAA